jgi:hypothetical protein
MVFISSAIIGLERVRSQLHARLSEGDLAEAWLFELHATTGGEPAEAQYLDIARSCDLIVVIVGETQSTATEQEYAEAYRDNPDKILPLYLGSTTPAVRDFRALIDQRHSREKVNGEGELVAVATSGVERAIRSGRVIMRSLRDQTETRLNRLDALLDLNPPVAFVPLLHDGSQDISHAAAWGRGPHIVIEGVGGSGKTYGALVTLHRRSRVSRVPAAERDAGPESTGPDVDLPLYLRARPGHTEVEALIGSAFTSLRFAPGEELIIEYAHAGRLVLAVDGYDDLAANDRRELLRSLEAFAESFPRTRIAVLARSLPKLSLPGFQRLSPSQLTDKMLVELFAAHGQQIRGAIDIPAAVDDLIRLPFWAAAMARFGLETESGLQLLQLLVEHRLDLAFTEPLIARKVREVLGAIALAMHPAIVVECEPAQEAVETWMASAPARERWEPEPTETMLERARESGLVEADADTITFLHPLLAAVLAAEASVERPEVRMAVEAHTDLASMTAALLPDSRAPDVLEILTEHDIFFLARVLRLSYGRARVADFEVDLERYRIALRRLSPLAGEIAAARLCTGVVLGASSNRMDRDRGRR